jgi:hypothetical protein
MKPLEPGRRGPVFHVTLRSGVWQVRRDSVFFGDYHLRDAAVGAACAAASAEQSRGLMAQVFEPPSLTPLPLRESHPGA